MIRGCAKPPAEAGIGHVPNTVVFLCLVGKGYQRMRENDQALRTTQTKLRDPFSDREKYLVDITVRDRFAMQYAGSEK